MMRRLLFILAILGLSAAFAVNFYRTQFPSARSIGSHNFVRVSAVPKLIRWLRPVYPYSVIPGGAYSVVELRKAIEKDPLVRQHYAGFDLRNTRLVMLKEDRLQYASFRRGDHIFWTSKPLKIARGEFLLTDGVHFARTRCGNRLSSTRQNGNAPDEPSEQEFSLPPFHPESLRELVLEGPPEFNSPTEQLASVPAGTLPFQLFLPVVDSPPNTPFSEAWLPSQSFSPITPGGGFPYILKSPGPHQPPANIPPVEIMPGPPVLPVPEPSTLFFLAIALSAFAARWLLRRQLR